MAELIREVHTKTYKFSKEEAARLLLPRHEKHLVELYVNPQGDLEIIMAQEEHTGTAYYTDPPPTRFV